ncbi:hypothetical protein C8J56DRAFT_8644 [Mycena floridula]|nr:hypothetical protein C8J56DRAFT_8644 [Mycena floridula]
MTLPIALASPPSAGNSPTSDDNSSHGGENNNTNGSNSNNMKRKPSRRANTAERRATHNAVERQRRETLNGRFLDLAALLPNLSQIRRPSKSSIVNSSIAHIHASRRHRLLASRELRLVKLEADALRRELNEWRDRANIPRVEEPARGEGFSMVLGGELEMLVVGGVGGDDDEEYNGGGYDDEEYGAPTEEEDSRIPMMKPATVAPPAPFYPPQRPQVVIASPTAMTFENPAMGSVYPENHIQYPQHFSGPQHYSNPSPIVDAEKVAHWNLYQQQQQHHQMLQRQQQNPVYLASLGRTRSGSMGSGASASPPHIAGTLTLGSSSGSSSGSASPVQHPFDGYGEWMNPNQKIVNVGGGNGNGAVFAMMM